MKRQTYWKAIGRKGSLTTFKEAQGYIIDVTTDYGYTAKIAFEYDRPYWYATHYETGLACNPWKEIKEYPNKSDKYKSKEELIERLKQVNFEKVLSGEAAIKVKQQLDEFKAKQEGQNG